VKRAVVAYVLRDGLLLSVPRLDTGEHAAPGGKVEPGETYEEGLARELDEETGLRIARAWRVFDGTHGVFAVRAYRVEALGEPVAKEPGSRVVWVPAEAIATGFAGEYHTAALTAAGLLNRTEVTP
jgi:8-oxo-dGTP diphosphatase